MEDLYYPSYHFRPEKNWMNDPNGPVWFQGNYHLFYQYNPYGDQWGTIHWGHAVSADLIRWEELSTALIPVADAGEIHCYSGCVTIREGIPHLFYTSVGTGDRGPKTGAQQWSAVSYDGMRTWERKGMPAIPESLHGDRKIEMWRDPFLWQEDGGWYAVLGGTEDQKGCLLLYYSDDLEHWEYLNKIYESETYWLVECPVMLPLGGDRYLILYSPLDAVHYMTASLNRRSWTLEVEREGIFDHSILKNGFYAPNTWLNDPKGRMLIMGWISEADRPAASGVNGWAGMQSLPREVTEEADGTLRIRPAEECEMLRGKLLANEHACVPFQTEERRIRLASSRAAEFLLHAEVGEEGRLFLSFFSEEEGREETQLVYNGKTHRLTLDRSRSSLWEGVNQRELSCCLAPVRELEIRVYIDHSVMEVFACGQETITARVYPKLPESTGIYIQGQGEVRIRDLKIWELSTEEGKRRSQ